MFKPKQAFAINFSDFSLEALELSHEGKLLALKSRSRVLLQSGIIEDGKIVQKELLRDAVRKLLQQAKPEPITSKEVAITLPESRVLAQVYELPKSLPKKQVPSALFSQAGESMPIDAKLMVADYRKVGSTETGNRYLFAATYSDIVNEYVSFFQTLHLKVTLVTMESLALGAALLDEKKAETVLVLDVGARTTIASIFRHGELQESININIAGNNITAAIAEKLKVSSVEAERRKVNTGMSSAEDAGAEMLIIQGQIQPLKDELLVFIKFFEKSTGWTIDHVLLAGGTASMVGLGEYFSSNLGLPVTIADQLPALQIAIEKPLLAKFLVVLGLARIALGERRRDPINFLEHKDKDWTPARHSLRGVGKKVQTQTSKRPLTQLQKSRLRPFLLFGVLIIAFGLFASIYWWRNRPVPPPDSVSEIAGDAGTASTFRDTLNVIIKPFTKEDRSKTTLSFVFPVSLRADAVQAGDLLGRLENVSLTKAVPYDTATENFLRRSLDSSQNGPGRSGSEESIDAALQEYLIAQLWEAERDNLISERDAEGDVLLPSYVSFGVNSAEKLEQYEDGSDLKALSLDVTYEVMLIDEKAVFTALEDENIKYFTGADTGLKLESKSFKYEPLEGTDRIRVIAFYIFN